VLHFIIELAILKKITSEQDFNRLLKNVVSKINSLKIDLDNREISKSKALVTSCLKKYPGALPP